MFKRSLEALILSASILTNCSIINKTAEKENKTEIKKEEYGLEHKTSCGPKALNLLLKQIGISLPKEEISRRIIEKNKGGNLLRYSLGLIDSESHEITWPWELENFLNEIIEENFPGEYLLKKRTGSHKKLKPLLKKSILNKEKGIALINNNGNISTYHWIYFPNEKHNVLTYYKKTIIEEFYTLEELKH